jgi:hypothetical protein
MLASGSNGYIKKGTFTNEIVWGNYSYIFPCMNKKSQTNFKKGMFLFGMVRRDAKRFLQKRPNFRIPKRHAQIEYNKDVNFELFGKVTGTDLNHAYWRIAYNLGVISDKTYIKGIDDKFKSVRLAALSTLGSDKKYQRISGGKITQETLIIKGEEDLQRVYVLIRLTCYKYMSQVKKMLGKDFLCYKTDAIYYIDTKENRQKVREFFKSKDLLMKQLV